MLSIEVEKNFFKVNLSISGKFSREWLLWTGYASGSSLRKNLNRQPWSIRRKISHRCSRNFQCYIVFRKTGVLACWLFAFVFKELCTETGGKLPREISRQRKNRNFSILNSSTPSQNNKTIRTSCRRLFENFLPQLSIKHMKISTKAT